MDARSWLGRMDDALEVTAKLLLGPQLLLPQDPRRLIPRLRTALLLRSRRW